MSIVKKKSSKPKRRAMTHPLSKFCSQDCSSLSSCSPQRHHSKVCLSRQHLQGVSILQKNAILIQAIPASVSKNEILNYFKNYGKISICVMNPISHMVEPQYDEPQMSSTVYIAFTNERSAANALKGVETFKINCDRKEDKRSISSMKASYASTKYCTHFLNGHDCGNRDCLFLHEEVNLEIESPKIVFEMGMNDSIESTSVTSFDSPLHCISYFEWDGESFKDVSFIRDSRMKSPESPLLTKPIRVSPDLCEVSTLSQSSSQKDFVMGIGESNVARRLFNPLIGKKVDKLLAVGEKHCASSDKKTFAGIKSPWDMKSPFTFLQETSNNMDTKSTPKEEELHTKQTNSQTVPPNVWKDKGTSGLDFSQQITLPTKIPKRGNIERSISVAHEKANSFDPIRRNSYRNPKSNTNFVPFLFHKPNMVHPHNSYDSMLQHRRFSQSAHERRFHGINHTFPQHHMDQYQFLPTQGLYQQQHRNIVQHNSCCGTMAQLGNVPHCLYNVPPTHFSMHKDYRFPFHGYN